MHPVLVAAGGIATFGSVLGFLVALAIGYACSKIARDKGRGPVLWGILGFLFTIVTLVVVLLVPSKERARA